MKENIEMFVGIVVVLLMITITCWIAHFFDSKKRNVFLPIVILFAWLTFMLCIDGSFKSLHGSSNANVGIVASLLSYSIITIFFGAPELFNDARGLKLSEEGRVVKAISQLTIASLPCAFYIWQKYLDSSLSTYVCVLAASMFTLLLISVLGTLTVLHKPNKFRNYIFKKSEIPSYVREISKNLPTESKNIVKQIEQNGFAVNNCKDSDSFNIGIIQLVNFGVPIVKYSFNSTSIYTYGDDSDMQQKEDKEIAELRGKSYQKVSVSKVKIIALSKFMSGISETTGVDKSIVEKALKAKIK